MPALPKTNTNFKSYAIYPTTLNNGGAGLAASFTITLQPNVLTHVLTATSAGTVAGTNVINLPANWADGDEVYIMSNVAVTGLTVVAPSGATIDTLGAAAVTALTAGVQVGYLRQGTTIRRVQ